MKRALSVAWFTIRAVYDEFFVLSGMGIIWFLVAATIPYGIFSLIDWLVPVPGLALGAAVVAFLPALPFTGALYYVAVHVAREERIEFGYFWTGLRTYLWPSLKMGVVILAGGVILLVDVVFYVSSENTVFAVLGLLGLWVLLFWLGIQVYLFPLLVIQEDKRLLMTLRNGSLLALAYPFFTLGILLVALLATVLSTLFLLILLATVWMPLIAVLYSRATISALQEVESYQRRRREIEQERDET